MAKDAVVGSDTGKSLLAVHTVVCNVVAGAGGGVVTLWRGVESKGEPAALGDDLLRPGQRRGGVDGVHRGAEKDLAEEEEEEERSHGWILAEQPGLRTWDEWKLSLAFGEGCRKLVLQFCLRNSTVPSIN
uniref:Uncharacterized protein n=1 Tax=Oryza barthii TaxID=65489 RepID=A0A0D3GS92_9ORYZ